MDTTISADSYSSAPLINPRIQNGLFTPWLKNCPTRNEICCRDISKKKPSKPTKNICPSGYSGLRPVPGDCTKFANCWKGNPIIQSCGPGTHFNPTNSVCDWPSKANCNPLDFQDDDQEDEIIVPDQSDVDDIGTVQFLTPKMHFFFQSHLSLNLT